MEGGSWARPSTDPSPGPYVVAACLSSVSDNDDCKRNPPPRGYRTQQRIHNRKIDHGIESLAFCFEFQCGMEF